MNVVDSSAWIEYFSDTKNAENFAVAIENVSELIVPTIVIFEVYKKYLREKGETMALDVLTQMKQGKIVEFDEYTAVLAAKMGHEMGLRFADSAIYATAWIHDATLWTQDEDFKNIDGVKYFKKK